MKFIFLIFCIFLISCGYSDIDSVPTFNNLTISEQEAIDLCNLSNTDSKALSDCLKNIKIQK